MMFFEVYPAGEFAVIVINANLMNIEDTLILLGTNNLKKIKTSSTCCPCTCKRLHKRIFECLFKL